MPSAFRGFEASQLGRILELQEEFFRPAQFYRNAGPLNNLLRAVQIQPESHTAANIADWWNLLSAVMWLVNTNQQK